jgi:hypothetical protein
MKKIKNRILPQDDSQEAIVLDHLRNKGPITNLKAVFQYRICRLSAVIDRLRDKNWNIETVEKRTEKGGYYGEYNLID